MRHFGPGSRPALYRKQAVELGEPDRFAAFPHAGGDPAAIGKVKRLRDEGVLPRDAIKHYEVKPAQAGPKRSPPVTPRPAPALDGTVPCSILELDYSRCRWPLGEMHEVAVLFCGGAQSDVE